MTTPQDLIATLDLTTLSGDETEAEIDALCERATEHRVAAVCVYGEWVARCKAAGVKVATVANFPQGDASPQQVADEVARWVADGADEVDVVIPYTAGPEAWAATVEAARDACPVILKVILETGQLSAEQVGDAALVALEHGADFLKTSTGKTQPGATLEAARTLITAGGGFKASGGVRTFEDARAYAELFTEIRGEPADPDQFRIGASSLLDDLLAR